MRKVTRKVMRMGVVPVTVLVAKALGMTPSQREKLRSQLADMAGKKPPGFLSIFLVRPRIFGRKRFG